MLSREPVPDFVRSRRLGRDPSFLQLLTFGMFFDHARARKATEWAEECKERWDGGDLSNDELEQLLTTVVGDVVGASHERPVTVGLSAGYDSRPMLRALWQLGLEPRTYTFGQAGNLDFDLVSLLAGRLELDTVFIDTSNAEWQLEVFDHDAEHTQDLPVSPRVVAGHAMDARCPTRVDVHGYLNDALTGGTRPRDITSDPLEAMAAFAQKNDHFGMQELMPAGTVERLLPANVVRSGSGLTPFQQLDIGYRQTQRIRLSAGVSRRWMFPFEDDRWVGYWLTRPEEDLANQRRWLDFVHSLGGELFFDLAPFEETNRRRLRRKRLELVYGNDAGGELIAMPTSKALPANPTQHFDLFACHSNNHSFRRLVQSSITRLQGRRIFTRGFVEDVVRRFLAGDVAAAKLLNGLVTTDIAIEARRF